MQMILVDFDLIGTAAIRSHQDYRTGQQSFERGFDRGWGVWILLRHECLLMDPSSLLRVDFTSQSVVELVGQC